MLTADRDSKGLIAGKRKEGESGMVATHSKKWAVVIKSYILPILMLTCASFFSPNTSYAESVGYPVIDDNSGDSLAWDVPWNYFGHYYSGMGGFHPGEDWNLTGGSASADLGKPVYSIADGIIKKISDLGNIGYLVGIEHSGNFTIPGKSATENGQSYSYTGETVTKVYSIYVHINSLPSYAAEGQSIKKGTVIGYIMDPGGGSHLHFEIRHPNASHSNNWSVIGNSSNWAKVDGNYTGYYLNLQQMVDAGARDPRDFINANQVLSPTDKFLTYLNPDPNGNTNNVYWVQNNRRYRITDGNV